jgi:DNA (cytosine-5)-methyltransferase 1
MYTHLDLFSGIGGFALGLQRTGKFKTIAFCEFDEFCHRVLRKNFGNVPIIKDIKSFDTERFIQEHGRPFIITGGFPCQGFSQANANREGTDNSKGRDLWPQMYRIISDLKPIWIIGENVSGFATFPLAFERTATDLEASGYQTVCFNIPACATNLKHERQRLWIVSHLPHSNSNRDEGWWREERGTAQRLILQSEQGRSAMGSASEGCSELFRQRNFMPRVDRIFLNGLSDRMDESEFGVPRVTFENQDRAARLKAIGNAVVPTIPEIIARAIIEAEGD